MNVKIALAAWVTMVWALPLHADDLMHSTTAAMTTSTSTSITTIIGGRLSMGDTRSPIVTCIPIFMVIVSEDLAPTVGAYLS